MDDECPHKGKTGLRRIWNALGYSMDGFANAFCHESAFRQEVVLAAVLIPLSVYVPTSGVGHAMLVGSILLVILVELLNSAIEATVDRISLENHHLAKRAKDFGSAAVLVSLINTATTWALILVLH